MPVSTRITERWICDRCGKKGEFPDWANATAVHEGWLQFDLGRSLRADRVVQMEKNIQVLCPECVEALRVWFQTKSY